MKLRKTPLTLIAIVGMVSFLFLLSWMFSGSTTARPHLHWEVDNVKVGAFANPESLDMLRQAHAHLQEAGEGDENVQKVGLWTNERLQRPVLSLNCVFSLGVLQSTGL